MFPQQQDKIQHPSPGELWLTLCGGCCWCL